jgi:hypothetical protein
MYKSTDHKRNSRARFFFFEALSGILVAKTEPFSVFQGSFCVWLTPSLSVGVSATTDHLSTGTEVDMHLIDISVRFIQVFLTAEAVVADSVGV